MAVEFPPCAHGCHAASRLTLMICSRAGLPAMLAYESRGLCCKPTEASQSTKSGKEASA